MNKDEFISAVKELGIELTEEQLIKLDIDLQDSIVSLLKET